jgi:hypothetical protein
MIFDRFFRLSESPGVGVRCSGQGLFVGSTPLLESVPAHNGRAEWRVRRADAIARDLSKNYGMPVAVSAKMPGISAIARALNDGNLAHAQIATLLLKFPDPPDLIESSPPFGDVVDLAKQLYASDLLNRDSDPTKHPRWPALSPDGVGGQFAPADGAADGSNSRPTGNIQAQIAIPLPPFDIPAPGAIPFPWEILPPPLVTPNILPRTLPQNPYPGRPECVKEWQEAFAFCWRLKINRQLGRGASRGMGRTLRDCMLGQVSESCGGNAATI